MANFTLLEIHLEEGSFSANLPFGSTGTKADRDAYRTSDEEVGVADADGGSKKKLAVVGVFVFLVAAAAAVKYFTGESDPDVAIETADEEPIGVSVEE